MACDSRHLQELMDVYYPNTLARVEPAPEEDEAASTESLLALLPYTCCNTTYLRQSHAFAHYFEVHFGTALQDWTAGQPNPCTQFRDVGNPAIPIVRRVAFFLDSLKHPPRRPQQFRPAPHSRGPLDFANPYSACLAMAYDYLHVQRAPQYVEFVNVMKFHASINNLRLSPACHWPCWAHFFYPALAPRRIVFKAPPLRPLFRCQEHGCGKAFQQVADLHHHLANHRRPPKPKALKCPFLPCKNTYQSATGMCNHLKKFHLDPIHFERDKHAPASPLPATCPIVPCEHSSPNLAQLRLHIVKKHFWSAAEMEAMV